MEDSPLRKGEETADLESDAKESGRHSTQDFLERWRRFSKRDNERYFGIHNHEEDDDDTIENESLNTPSKKRFKRLRRRLRPFLPQPQTVTERSYDIDTDDSMKDMVGSENQETSSEKSSTREKSLATVEEASIIDQDEIRSNEPVSNIIDRDSKNKSDTSKSTVLDVNSEAVPAVESIEHILRRRDQDTDKEQYIREQQLDTEMASANNREMNEKFSSNSDESHIERAPVGGLLAVDLLNYRIAKKRDNRNKSLHEKQHTRIIKEQDMVNKRVEERLNKSEKQHLENFKTVEIKPTTYDKQIVNKSNDIIYNRNDSEKIHYSVDKPEYKSVFTQTPENINNINNYQIQESSKSFENTLERVARAEEGKIQSEFQFERRHEVKDEPGVKIPKNHVEQPFITESSSKIGAKPSTPIDNRLYDIAEKHISNEAKHLVYKQAAVTGFWGAVAGIVAFLIMYMLASR